MNDLIEYTGDGDNDRQSEFHDLDLDEIGTAACEALKAACEATNKWIEGREEWIEETLRLARLLVEGRQRFPSNEAFGKWIDGIKGLSLLSHQDRAALIQLGKWPAITRDVLEKTRRNSWREIWDKEAKRVLEPSGGSKKRRVTSPGKMDDDEVDDAEVTELKQENEERLRQIDHLEKQLDTAVAASVAPILWDETPEDMADRIISEAGEEKAKAIAACIVKHFKRPPGRLKALKPSHGTES